MNFKVLIGASFMAIAMTLATVLFLGAVDLIIDVVQGLGATQPGIDSAMGNLTRLAMASTTTCYIGLLVYGSGLSAKR